MEKWIHFRAERCQKYVLYQKMLEIKIVEHLISYKKVSGAYISISPGSESERLQRLPFIKCYNVLQWKSRFTLLFNTTKNTHYIKNGSIENQVIALWQFIIHPFYNTFRALVSVVLLKIHIIMHWNRKEDSI